MGYAERGTPVPGAVLWRVDPEPLAVRRRILPDGCLDLIWDGGRIFVAGPDSAARWSEPPVGAGYVGLRLAGGLGPALLGVPADQLRDRTPDLAQLWCAASARELLDRVGADSLGALTRWAVQRAGTPDRDALGPAVLALAAQGAPATTIADRVGLSTRHLNRRCHRIFGYGPRQLLRVVRLQRALGAARAGTSLTRVAAECGFSDQAHLTREVRALTGTIPTALLAEPAFGPPDQPASEGANRSTGLPSGSCTTA